MTKTLINHQGYQYIPIREDYWQIFSRSGKPKALVAAACKVLAVLESWACYVSTHQGRDWVKMSFRQLTQTIKEHGIRTIRAAIEFLEEEVDLIEREKRTPKYKKGEWQNPASTFWYRLDVESIQAAINRLNPSRSLLDPIGSDNETATNCSNPDDDLLDSTGSNVVSLEDRALDPVGSNVVSHGIEILGSTKNTSNQHTDNNVIARADFFEKEVDQEELIALGVAVAEVKECLNRNFSNYEGALLELKRQVTRGGCKNPTGFFMKALRNDWGKPSAAQPRELQIAQPSSEQLRSLIRRFGFEKVYEGVIFNATLGFPRTWFVDFGDYELPWWQAASWVDSNDQLLEVSDQLPVVGGQCSTAVESSGLTNDQCSTVCIVSLLDKSSKEAICASLRQRQGRTQQRLAITPTLNECSSLTNSSAASVDSAKLPNSPEASPSETTLTSTQKLKPFTSTITQALTSTEISEPTTPTGEPMSSPVGFPARAHQVLVLERDLLTPNPAFGLKPCDALSRGVQTLWLLRTLKVLSIEDYGKFLGDSEWQAIRGTIRSSYRQLGSALYIAGIDFSSLPTPTTYSEGSANSRPAGNNKLEQALKLLPSPVAADATTAAILTEGMKFRTTKNGTLRKISNNGIDGSVGLSRTLMLLPTPMARDGKGPTGTPGESVTEPIQERLMGSDKMHPAVPGWMMGFPTGYAEKILMVGGEQTRPLNTRASPPEPQDAEPASNSTAEASCPNKPRSHSVESSTSTHLFNETQMIPCTIKQPGQPEVSGTIVQDLGSNFAVQIENFDKPVTVPKLYVYPGVVAPKWKENDRAYYHQGPCTILIPSGKGKYSKQTKVATEENFEGFWVPTNELCAVQHALLNNQLDAALSTALRSLEKLRQEGTTNSQLKEAINRVFGSGTGSNVPTHWYAKGGKSPKFWLRATPSYWKPDLQGKALVDKVRELYVIPFPKTHPQTEEEALLLCAWKVGDRFVRSEVKGTIERFGTITELRPRLIGPSGDEWWEVYLGALFDDERDGSRKGEVIDIEIEKLKPKSANTRALVNSGLSVSFGKTLEQLYRGKSVTRRVWSAAHVAKFIKCYEQGKRIQALDKDRRYGGKQIGWLTITVKPYQENLLDMPTEDLAAEGFPEHTLQEFIDEFFEGVAQTVWVIRFEFESIENERDAAIKNYSSFTTAKVLLTASCLR